MKKEYRLSEVFMKDPYFLNAFEKEVSYLSAFDTDRLLAGFRENAGIALNGVKRYGGWESMLIGGHTLGHYLSAASQAIVNAQITPEDKKVLEDMVRRLLTGLSECQLKSKGKPGFLFGGIILHPGNVEDQFDQVEKNHTNIITEAWVPWYTMHKILDGLVRCYELTGDKLALKIAWGIGDWAYERAKGWDTATRQTVISIEYGGMNDALYELYKCTHDEKHLWVAHVFDETALFEAVLAGGKNVLTNKHANTTIPKFLGALNRYLVTKEERYLAYAEAFFDMVKERHTYITGGNSEWEHFGEDFVLDKERTNCNNETCNTYNMLKLTRTLFFITGKKKYADYYENTLINAILSSQNPHTGMSMYFQPMATGYFKVYGTGFDKFWCCTGSGMENFTKLNDSIYCSSEDGIVTNLYISSDLKDEKLGITLKQESLIPYKDEVKFTVLQKKENARSEISLSFRIPDWASNYQIYCNGELLGADAYNVSENGYIICKKMWQHQDEIRLKFGMKVIAHSLPDNQNVFAFCYGPVVLSADLGNENELSTTTGVDVTIPENKLSISEKIIIKDSYESVKAYMDKIDSHMRRDPSLGELTFVLEEGGRLLYFTPHYSKVSERYGIYWYFYTKKENQEKELTKKEAMIQKRKEHLLDTVQPGYGQYEVDELHALKDAGSVGSTDNGTSRYAKKGGSFSYRMKVAKGKDHFIEIHLLEEDKSKPLQIFVGESVVFDSVLNYNTENETFMVDESEYMQFIPVTKEVIESFAFTACDQDVVTVTIKGSESMDSKRLVQFIYMLWE